MPSDHFGMHPVEDTVQTEMFSFTVELNQTEGQKQNIADLFACITRVGSRNSIGQLIHFLCQILHDADGGLLSVPWAAGGAAQRFNQVAEGLKSFGVGRQFKIFHAFSRSFKRVVKLVFISLETTRANFSDTLAM